MSTLYLHIGTPKTGTTAIQYFLNTNRQVLISKGYIFPIMKEHFENVPSKRNAHFLINRFYDKEAAGTPEYEKKIKKCYKQIYNKLDEYENVILTDEAIWHVCKKIENFWEDLNEKITKRGHKLKLIVYLRRQDEFIQSYWKYKVLDRETCSFMEYVDSNKYAFFPLDYCSHLNSIAGVVGKDNIIVRVYEREQYEGEQKTIISDFLHSIGLSLTSEYKMDEGLQNTNLDYICTETKRVLNEIPEFCNKRGYIRKYMTEVSALNKEQGKYQYKSLFMPEEQDKFLKKYEEENRKTAIEWLGREDGRLFYAPVSYDDKSKEFSSEDYILILGQIISMQMKEKKMLEEMKEEMPEKTKKAELKMKDNSFVKKAYGKLKNIVKNS